MVTMQPLFSRRSESSLGKDKWTAAPAAASARSSCGLRRGSSKSRRAVTVKHIPGFRDSVRSDRKQNSSQRGGFSVALTDPGRTLPQEAPSLGDVRGSRAGYFLDPMPT